jgi:hypothetical protein
LGMLISLNQRNPIILNSGDVLLGILLFWSMFLPLGAVWSVDSRAINRSLGGNERRVVSFGTAAILIQVTLVYLMSGRYKSTDASWSEGDALYYVLNIDQIASAFGQQLLQYDGLLRAMTRAAYLLEKYGPLLAFIPFGITPFRLATVVMFVGFHAGIALTMEIGLFPYICMAAWIVFLPSWFWDRLERYGRRVSFGLSKNSLRWKMKWCPVASPARTESSDAVDRKLEPVNWRFRSREIVAAAALALVIAVNLDTLPGRPVQVPQSMHTIAHMVQLFQPWGMFSHPLREDGWYVVAAKLNDGREVDLFRAGQPLDWRKPALVSADYKTEPWRKYMLNLWLPMYRQEVRPFAQLLRRDWDANHDKSQQVVEVRVYFMLETTLPNNEAPKVSRELMYEWTVKGVDQVAPY